MYSIMTPKYRCNRHIQTNRQAEQIVRLQSKQERESKSKYTQSTAERWKAKNIIQRAENEKLDASQLLGQQ